MLVLHIDMEHGTNLYASISVIQSEAVLQRAWQQIVVFLPKGDSMANDACDQA